MDLVQQATALFMRVLQRDQSERPKIHIEPGAGVEMLVVIYIGDVPPKLSEHYARQTVAEVRKPAPLRYGEADPDATSRVGRGPTFAVALRQIVDELKAKLRARIESDAGIFELCFPNEIAISRRVEEATTDDPDPRGPTGIVLHPRAAKR